MASLDMGPMNRYQHITSENTRHMIDTLAAEMQEKGIKPEMEVFNNGHMNEVHRLIDKGLLEEPYYINIIFGPGTLTPPTPENMVNMVNNLPENSIFNVLAIGPHQLPLTTMGIVMGGHVRIGMEDNLYYRRGEPAEQRPARRANGSHRRRTRPGTRDACGGARTARDSDPVIADSSMAIAIVVVETIYSPLALERQHRSCWPLIRERECNDFQRLL